MKCDLVMNAVPELARDGRPLASGTWRAEGYCKTHSMACPQFSVNLPDGDVLCPIGRIEKAVDDGIAKIEAARER